MVRALAACDERVNRAVKTEASALRFFAVVIDKALMFWQLIDKTCHRVVDAIHDVP